MRVLFVAPCLRSGGAERQLYELASQLLLSNYEVIIVTISEGCDVYSAKLKELGAEQFHFDNRSKLHKLKCLYDLVQRLRPNVLHGFLNIGCMYALPISMVSGIPLISSAIRDAKNQNWKYELCYLALAHFSKFFVSNSKAGFSTRFRKWKRNFRVVYNGMRLERFQNINVVGSGYNDNVTKKLVMVASVSEHKDHQTLLKALQDPRLNKFQLQLNLVGDEPPTEKGARRRLEETAKAMGLSGQVTFLGYRADVEKYISEADISILLTNSEKHLEGLSNTIAESLALGKPVIATNSGGTPELIDDGVHGLLVPDGDSKAVAGAIEKLLIDPALANLLGHNGREKIMQGFDVNRMADEYVALYEKSVN